jgi:iron complex transport system substrate-binding protein
MFTGWSQLAGAAIDVVDDAGRPVHLAQPARRIISLSPHLTELLFSAGAGKQVVGVVSFSSYPPAARDITQVGDFQSLDLERIVSLHPDLIVSWQTGNHPGQIDKLRRLGFKVFVNEPRKLLDIPKTIIKLGKLAGTDATAQQVADRFMQQYHRLQQQYQSRKPVRVFYQIWSDPLMTVNGEHLISDVIRLCGGKNVFADMESLAPEVSIESVLQRAPEAIVVGGGDELQQRWLEHWRHWPTLPAVRQDNLFQINPDLLQRHTVRILQGAETLCRDLERARR